MKTINSHSYHFRSKLLRNPHNLKPMRPHHKLYKSLEIYNIQSCSWWWISEPNWVRTQKNQTLIETDRDPPRLGTRIPHQAYRRPLFRRPPHRSEQLLVYFASQASISIHCKRSPFWAHFVARRQFWGSRPCWGFWVWREKRKEVKLKRLWISFCSGLEPFEP